MNDLTNYDGGSHRENETPFYSAGRQLHAAITAIVDDPAYVQAERTEAENGHPKGSSSYVTTDGRFKLEVIVNRKDDVSQGMHIFVRHNDGSEFGKVFYTWNMYWGQTESSRLDPQEKPHVSSMRLEAEALPLSPNPAVTIKRVEMDQSESTVVMKAALAPDLSLSGVAQADTKKNGILRSLFFAPKSTTHPITGTGNTYHWVNKGDYRADAKQISTPTGPIDISITPRIAQPYILDLNYQPESLQPATAIDHYQSNIRMELGDNLISVGGITQIFNNQIRMLGDAFHATQQPHLPTPPKELT